MSKHELPNAIRAITVEESTWKMQVVDDKRGKLVEVGRKGSETYYRKFIEGTRDIGYFALIDKAKPEPIDPRHARALRLRHDGQWRARPRIFELVSSLWERGMLRERSNGKVIGRSGIHPEKKCSYGLSIGIDGDLKLQITNPPFEESFRPLAWNIYHLPRGVSEARRLFQFVHHDAAEPMRRVIDSHAIAGYFVANLISMQQIAEHGSPEYHNQAGRVRSTDEILANINAVLGTVSEA